MARGGDITWHGPGQLVGYAIVGSRRPRPRPAPLPAGNRSRPDPDPGTLRDRRPDVAGKTGVWVGEEPSAEKIASIGIAVRRWVGYHGFALNVQPDLGFFDLIHPCGLQGVRMTSIAIRKGAEAPRWRRSGRSRPRRWRRSGGWIGRDPRAPREARKAAGLDDLAPGEPRVHPRSESDTNHPAIAAPAGRKGTRDPDEHHPLHGRGSQPRRDPRSAPFSSGSSSPAASSRRCRRGSMRWHWRSPAPRPAIPTRACCAR